VEVVVVVVDKVLVVENEVVGDGVVIWATPMPLAPPFSETTPSAATKKRMKVNVLEREETFKARTS